MERFLEAYLEAGHKYVPGFGHRFHPVDPRAPRILELADQATEKGVANGEYAAIQGCNLLEQCRPHCRGAFFSRNDGNLRINQTFLRL